MMASAQADAYPGASARRSASCLRRQSPQNDPDSPTSRRYAWAADGSRRAYPRSSLPAYHPLASRHTVARSVAKPRCRPSRASQASRQESLQKTRWLPHVNTTSSHMCAAGTRKWASWSPSGGASWSTTQACAPPQPWHVVATRTAGSPGTRCGIANESQMQPPHHRVRVPFTEKPRSIVEHGWASAIRPLASSAR